MNKKEIIELKNKISDVKSKISKLDKLLQDNAEKEFELLAPNLIEQKNTLLIEAQLGTDNATELAQIERRIVEATKIDHKNKDNEAKRRDFVKTIQVRIDAEKEVLNDLVTKYKAAATAFLINELAEKENQIKLAEDTRFKRVIEADAIESVISMFSDKNYASGITTNKERVFELWKTRCGAWKHLQTRWKWKPKKNCGANGLPQKTRYRRNYRLTKENRRKAVFLCSKFITLASIAGQGYS